MALSLTDILAISFSLLTVAVSGGLVFSFAIQPDRRATSYVVMGLCAVTILWAVSMLLRTMMSIMAEPGSEVLLRIHMTAMALAAGVYFFFVLTMLEPSGIFSSILVYTSPIVIIVSLGIIWLGNIFDPTTQDLTQTGYMLLVAAAAYLALTFWIVISSEKTISTAITMPAGLFLAAYVVNFLDPIRDAALDLALLSTAIGLFGRDLLRVELLN
ncbi:MAG: hypothetical protein ACOCX5_00170, partial [Chloroflexota bacterium]